MQLNLPKWPFIDAILKEFPDSEVFLVGGAVRDALLKRPVKDYDFVVRNVAITNLITFLKHHGKVDLVGKRFGVLKFRPKDSKETFDIALPRRESSRSFSGAYRDFDVQSDHHLAIEEDLARRDFSINAMAYNLATNELVDPFFGEKDLQDKIIRTVGAAVTRFQEDYSRMLRAIRFACQLDFELSDKTATTIQSMIHHLNDKDGEIWIVAREVIGHEFCKAFKANPVRCLTLLDELHGLEVILPEVKALQDCEQSPPYHLEGSVYKHTILALQSINTEAFRNYFPTPIPLISLLGILFHDIGKPLTSSTDKKGSIHFYGHPEKGAELASKICKRLHLGSLEGHSFACKELAWLVKHHLFSIFHAKKNRSLVTLEQLLFSKDYPSQSLLHVMLADQLGTKHAPEVDATQPFEALDKQLQELAPNGTLPQPLLSGDDVIELLDIKPGPQVRHYLEQVREIQLSGKISTKEEALSLLSSRAKS